MTTSIDDALAITLATADAWEEVEGPDGFASFLRHVNLTPNTLAEATAKASALVRYKFFLEGLINANEVVRRDFCSDGIVSEPLNYCSSCGSIIEAHADTAMEGEIQAFNAWLTEENAQAQIEQDRYNREFTDAFIGNTHNSHMAMHINIVRGRPEGIYGHGIAEDYEMIRGVLAEGLPPNPPYSPGVPGIEIGPIEDSYFVIFDDLEGGEINDIRTDTNGEIWQRRKINYQELVRRIKEMEAPTSEAFVVDSNPAAGLDLEDDPNARPIEEFMPNEERQDWEEYVRQIEERDFQ